MKKRVVKQIIKLANELKESVASHEKDLTVQELYNFTWKHYWSQKKFKVSGWASNVKKIWERNIRPSLADKMCSALGPSEIRAWHESMGSKPIDANRSLEVLSRMFRYAEERELRVQGTNPCALVKSFKEKKRKRFATSEEIQGIIAILEREKKDYPREAAFIYLLLFTGARPSSIERATAKQLKLITHECETYGVLTFNGKSSEKTGEEECVVLPPQVVPLISTKWSNSNDSLLGIKMPKYFWARIQKELNCPDLWARDLRRTFATIGLSNGADMGVIGQLLNHKSTQTTSIYAKLIQTEKLNTANLIANEIVNLTKGRK